MISLPIEEDRFTLRRFQRTDAADLVIQANSRRVWRNMTHLFPYPYTDADALDWINRTLTEGRPQNLAIVVEERVAGGCGIRIGEGVGDLGANIGYWLGEEYWGRGLATQALRTFLIYVWDSFPVERLQAEVFAWNPGSARVLEKNGFQLEGTRRKAIHKDGELIDEWFYSLLRSDVER